MYAISVSYTVVVLFLFERIFVVLFALIAVSCIEIFLLFVFLFSILYCHNTTQISKIFLL